MTDNEIIKALECCEHRNIDGEALPNCYDCPMWSYCNVQVADIKEGRTLLFAKALDLINRQKAEIERLKTMHNEMCIGMKVLKQKAIKEFAERLKSKQIIKHRSKEGFCVYEFDDELIDNLVKEMVGE